MGRSGEGLEGEREKSYWMLVAGYWSVVAVASNQYPATT
jgi:hypothetical protein